MMVFLPIAGYIEILRDVYETYCLFCFWVMLVLWCGGQRRVVDILSREEPLDCYVCPLLQPFGCGLPVTRFVQAKGLFRYAAWPTALPPPNLPYPAPFSSVPDRLLVPSHHVL
jgi:Organic solute transporter Ostalpha